MGHHIPGTGSRDYYGDAEFKEIHRRLRLKNDNPESFGHAHYQYLVDCLFMMFMFGFLTAGYYLRSDIPAVLGAAVLMFVAIVATF